MTVFTTSELAGLQAAQVAHMPHTAEILDRVESQDNYGQPLITWSSLGSYAIGLSMTPGREVQVGAETVIVDAKARLPMAARPMITQGNRVKITHLHGVEEGSPTVWDVVGLAAVGPSGLTLNLKRVIL